MKTKLKQLFGRAARPFAAAVALVALATPSYAAILRVGQSPMADFTQISDALLSAKDGDSIEIEKGTYDPVFVPPGLQEFSLVMLDSSGESPEIAIPNPAGRPGYVFDGWLVNDGTEPVKDRVVLTSGECKLVASWREVFDLDLREQPAFGYLEELPAVWNDDGEEVSVTNETVGAASQTWKEADRQWKPSLGGTYVFAKGADKATVVVELFPQAQKPGAAENLVYRGYEQRLVTSGSRYVVTSGAVNAKDVGEYRLELAPEPGYAWTDGSADPVLIETKIAKAALKLRIDSASCGLGMAPPEYTYTVEGLANRETWQTLGVVPRLHCDYTAETKFEGESKTFEISFANAAELAALGNYAVDITPGTLTVAGQFEVVVPAIDGATAVALDATTGEALELVDGRAKVPYGHGIAVTYTAGENLVFDNRSTRLVMTVDSVTEAQTLDVKGAKTQDNGHDAVAAAFPADSFDVTAVVDSESGAFSGFDVVLKKDLTGPYGIPDDLGDLFFDVNGHAIAGGDGESALAFTAGSGRFGATCAVFRDGAQTGTSGIFGGAGADAIATAEGAAAGCSWNIDEFAQVRIEGGEGRGSAESEVVQKPDGSALQVIVDTTGASEPPTAVEGLAAAVRGAVAADVTRVELVFSDATEEEKSANRREALAQAADYGPFPDEDVEFVFSDVEIQAYKGKVRTDDVTELNGLVGFSFAYDFTGRALVKTWRRHGGVLAQLPENAANANADGEYWTADRGNSRITVWAKKFSTYAISAMTDPVCQIGDVCYETVQAALDAAVDGDAVTLLQDVATPTLVLDGAGRRVLLDLAGHSVTAQPASSTAVRVSGGAALRIRDAAGGAVVSGGLETVDGGTLEILGGSYSANPSAYLASGCGMQLEPGGLYAVSASSLCPSLAYDENVGTAAPTVELGTHTVYCGWLKAGDDSFAAMLGTVEFTVSKPIARGRKAGLVRVTARTYEAATNRRAVLRGEGYAAADGTLTVQLLRGKRDYGRVTFQGESVVGEVLLGKTLATVEGGMFAERKTAPAKYARCKSEFKGAWNAVVKNAEGAAYLVSARVSAAGRVSVRVCDPEQRWYTGSSRLLIGKEGWAAIPVSVAKRVGGKVRSVSLVLWLGDSGRITAVMDAKCVPDAGAKFAMTAKEFRGVGLSLYTAGGELVQEHVDARRLRLSTAYGKITGSVKVDRKTYRVTGIAFGRTVYGFASAKNAPDLVVINE